MSQTNPTSVEIDTFAKSVIDDGDQSKAWRKTFPNSTAKPETIHEKASRFSKLSKVKARIVELRLVIADVAEEKFGITVEQRLRWLKDIFDAGMEQYLDAQGGKRRESLTASKSAIDTMNAMLGTDEDAGKVKPVKVMIGVKDASRA